MVMVRFAYMARACTCEDVLPSIVAHCRGHGLSLGSIGLPPPSGLLIYTWELIATHTDHHALRHRRRNIVDISSVVHITFEDKTSIRGPSVMMSSG
jgi:hypothetical protein